MKNKLSLLAVAVLVLSFAFGCADRLDDDVVMVVDGEEMTTEEFRDYTIMRFGGEAQARAAGEQQIGEYLNTVLEGKLMIVDGRNKGFGNRPEVANTYEEARNMAAIGELYQRDIVGKILPEDSLLAFYNRDGFEANASHILIRINEPGAADSLRAYNELVEIREKLLADGKVDSAEFAQAASQYSEDQSAPDGQLGFFRRGVMVPTFENVAFATQEGTMSEPVWTPFGWHLIFVHEINPVDERPSFEQDRDRILQLAMREYSQQLIDSARAYVKQLETERQVEFKMDNLQQIYDTVNPKLPNQDPFALLSEEQLDLVIASWDEGSEQLTAGDMREYVRRYISGRKLDSVEMLKGLTENYLTEKVLLPSVAEKKGYLSDEKVLDQARMAADQKIRQIIDEEMNRMPTATDEDLRAYYEEHASDYATDAQYTLVEILVERRELADSLKQLVEDGANMRELAMEHSKRAGVKDRNGTLGPIRKAQYGAIGHNAADAEIGELVGPIRVRSDWSLFKVISKEEPKPEEFDKVRKKVNVDWRAWARENRKSEYMDSLKNAIDHEVNEEAVKNLFGGEETGADS